MLSCVSQYMPEEALSTILKGHFSYLSVSFNGQLNILYHYLKTFPFIAADFQIYVHDFNECTFMAQCARHIEAFI